MQILVRCDRPGMLASRCSTGPVVERKSVLDGRPAAATKDADSFYLLLNRVIMDSGLEVESVAPADDDGIGLSVSDRPPRSDV